MRILAASRQTLKAEVPESLGVALGRAGADAEQATEALGIAVGGEGFVDQAVVAQTTARQVRAEVEVDPAVADMGRRLLPWEASYGQQPP
ncbi:hypothetical protein [Streptomyces sp. NPDC001978]|uniref:hypothetical protein n=1 Tax=Streptomyces sp. NPDC001978 TaxID=3364627 RepID=UPI0036BB23B3